MKRFLIILLVLTCAIGCAFSMTSCMSNQCASHSDVDANGLCDVCGTAYTCPGHADVNEDGMCDFCLMAFACTFHMDEDGNEKCDQCGAPYTCAHTDIYGYGYCDFCLATYTCPGHQDANLDGICDECQTEYVCPGHKDADANKRCDVCGLPWSCNLHKDSDNDEKCDYCDYEFECEGHVDAMGDGKCDKCDRDYTCPGHEDEDGDNECDICTAYYKAPEDFRADFVTASGRTDPSVLFVSVTTTEVGMPSLTSTYKVTYIQNGSFVIEFTEQRYNSDISSGDIVVTLPKVVVTCDASGNYSDGGLFVGSNPAATGIKVDFSKLKNYDTPNSTTLNATVAAADTSAVFGSAYGSNVELTVNKSETEITYVSLSYANVTITCTYN